MHRERRDVERQLQQGRGALRPEPGIRLLLPSPVQRPVVRESQDAGAAAGAAGGRSETCMSAGNMGVLSDVRESLLYLFADVIGEQDDSPAFLPDGLPESVAPSAGDAIHLLTEYQGTAYAKLYVDR